MTAKSIEVPREATIDDEFAKSLGMESLQKLKDAVRDQLKREFDGVSRQRLKRALLWSRSTSATISNCRKRSSNRNSMASGSRRSNR